MFGAWDKETGVYVGESYLAYPDWGLPRIEVGCFFSWRDYVLFHEYFHGDSGAGIGASHQTGWTALVANLIQSQNP